MPAELRFEAMGTWGHVVVVGGPLGAERRARERVEDLERRWSRFLPDSEVSQLNRSAGRPVRVSWETARLVARAVAARHLTGGLFDAAVLPALVAAGYDCSFEQLGREARGVGVAHLVGGGSTMHVDEGACLVTLGAGTGFDPGGIGKGLAADLVVSELMAEGAAGACVNLGGDLRVEGTAPGGGTWVVDVQDPFLPGPGAGPLLRLGLGRGAVATSSRLRRTWTAAGGERRHHLIDPATRVPAVTDAVAATVVAGTAWRAEAVATAAVVAGVEDGLNLMERVGVTGLIVTDGGAVHDAAGLASFRE